MSTRLLHLPLQRSRAPLALALGLLGFAAWAAAPRAEDARTADTLARVASALDVGDLKSATRDLHALLEQSPQLTEARLLEALLSLRRERPSLGWHEAFIQAWNDVGRPDFSESRVLPEEVPYEFPEEEEERLSGSFDANSLLTLLLEPEDERAHFVLQHLRELEPPELIFAVDDVLRHPSFPEELRLQGAQAVRARLAELTVASPQAMQYPALLLLEGSSLEAPFTPEELQALEAIAALPDWRATGFDTIFQRAASHFRAARHDQPAHAAFMLAVTALANRPAYILFKRTEASREVLSPPQLHRLGEALWRIGSRMAEESTLLERMLGTRMMIDGAELAGDPARAQQVSTQREEFRAAAEAMREAVPERWPLRSLNAAHMEAKMRDEMGCMLRFLPLRSASHGAP